MPQLISLSMVKSLADYAKYEFPFATRDKPYVNCQEYYCGIRDACDFIKNGLYDMNSVDAVPVESLKQWLATIPFHDLSDGKGVCYVCFREDFEKAIKRLNSFREAREPVPPMKPKVARRAASKQVVQCVDCIHFDPENYGGPTCDSVDGLQYPGCDDFCSNGERKDQSAEVRNMDGGGADVP